MSVEVLCSRRLSIFLEKTNIRISKLKYSIPDAPVLVMVSSHNGYVTIPPLWSGSPNWNRKYIFALAYWALRHHYPHVTQAMFSTKELKGLVYQLSYMILMA